MIKFYYLLNIAFKPLIAQYQTNGFKVLFQGLTSPVQTDNAQLLTHS
jgi:hypothetical protein